MYCSDFCKEQHKSISHDFFCDRRLYLTDQLMRYLELTLAMMMTGIQELGSFKEFYKLLKNPQKSTIFDSDELSRKSYVSIFATMTRSQYQKNACIQDMENLSSLIFVCPPIRELLNEHSIDDVKDCIVQLFQIRATNSLPVYIVDGRNAYSDTNIYSQIGSSMLAFGSLFSHSCNPNIDIVTLDNKMVFFANRPIKAGEPLFISYGPSFEKDHRVQRREKLRIYDFHCDCDACKNNYPLLDYLRPSRGTDEIPPFNTDTVDQSIETFKKNCELINELQGEHPCYESTFLLRRNGIAMYHVAKVRL